MNGRVIKNTGSWYVVRTDDCKDYNCKVKGNFRIKGIRTTNPVAVGDIVDITVNADGTAFIVKIAPRTNYIIRRASNLSKESHIIAANLDRALLVVSLTEPATSTTFIDRFLATAEAYQVPVTIAINKTDLYTDELADYYEAIKYVYESIGYEVLGVSATTGDGVDRVRDVISKGITLFSGNSGVGKSSLINALIPGLELRTANVSTSHHTGMHTTTFSEMFAIGTDAYIIDTPGVKGFGTIDFDVNEVSHFFPEIFRISANCRYGNCTHTHEPGCAVLKAVDESLISQSRYASYLSILEDGTEGKYRKPF